MFIEMILKTFPRSLRAGAALIIMLISLQQAFAGLQSLLLPDQGSGLIVVKFVIALVISIAAAIAFYYFQTIDDQPVKPYEVEILNKYQESQSNNQHHSTATPVFSSHQGEIKPDERESNAEASK